VTYLVLRSGLLSKGQDGRDTDSEMVSTDIVDPGLLDQRPDVRLLQVLDLVLVCGSKVSDHAAIVARDDHTTFPSGLDIVDAVFGVDTSLVAGVLEDLSILVAANAADVDDGVFREHVLQRTNKCQLR